MNSQKTASYLRSGEKIPLLILNQLKEANAKVAKTKNFDKYRKDIESIFGLTPPKKGLTSEFLHYLGGFIEGEGSLSVSAKKNNTSNFKVYLDPCFNITQHINGIQNLYLAMFVFKTGRIRFKSSSNATFVYVIDCRKTLKEKIIPFYKKYVCPYGAPSKVQRVQDFEQLLDLFEQKGHLNIDCMVNDILPLWDRMRMQQGQINQTFQNLAEAQQYVLNAAAK